MTESPALSRRYAELERSLEPDRRRSIARGPIGLIGVLVVLSLAVGTVAAIDLRRLQTPEGTALAWVGAAVFGDCKAYERLSVPGDREQDRRTREERCTALQDLTAPARERSAAYGIDLVELEPDGGRARARMRLTRPAGTRVVDLSLQRDDSGWRVVRTAATCRVLRCP